MILIKALLAKITERLNLLGDIQVKGWVNVTSSTSRTFSHSGTFRGILVAIGNNVNTVNGLWLINSASSSSHTAREVAGGSQLTVTPNFGAIAVASGVATTCHLWMICLEGTGTWA